MKYHLNIMFKRKEIWIGLYIFLIYSLFVVFYEMYLYIGVERLSIITSTSLFALNENNQFYSWFRLIFPIVIVLPYAFSNYYEKNDGVDHYVIQKMGQKKYIISGLLTAFIGSFVIIFVPFLINNILTLIAFYNNGNDYLGSQYTVTYVMNYHKNMFMSELYMFHPEIRNLIQIIITSFLGGIMGMLAYSASYLIKKYILLIFVPVYIVFFINERLIYFNIHFDLFSYLTISRSSYTKAPAFFLVCGVFLFIIYKIVKHYMKRDMTGVYVKNEKKR